MGDDEVTGRRTAAGPPGIGVPALVLGEVGGWAVLAALAVLVHGRTGSVATTGAVVALHGLAGVAGLWWRPPTTVPAGRVAAGAAGLGAVAVLAPLAVEGAVPVLVAAAVAGAAHRAGQVTRLPLAGTTDTHLLAEAAIPAGLLVGGLATLGGPVVALVVPAVVLVTGGALAATAPDGGLRPVLGRPGTAALRGWVADERRRWFLGLVATGAAAAALPEVLVVAIVADGPWLVPLLVAQPLAALLTAVVLAGDPRWEDPDMLLLLTGLVPLGALVASVGVSLHLAVVLLGVSAIGVGVGAGALVQAVALRALPGGDRSAVATAWTATLLVEVAGAALFGLIGTMLDPAGAYLAAAAITGGGIAWAAQTRAAVVQGTSGPAPADSTAG